MTYEGTTRVADVIGRRDSTNRLTSYYLNECIPTDYRNYDKTINNTDIDKEKWETKLMEIVEFQRNGLDLAVSNEQASKLINIYNKYKFLYILSKSPFSHGISHIIYRYETL